jgi:Zn-dependent metalloprotease
VGAAPPATPDVAAYTFLKQHATLFGAGSPQVDFLLVSTRSTERRTHLKFQQSYAGIPVFAAQVIIQLSMNGGVECVISDILTDTQDLDTGLISITPQLTPAEAEAKARAALVPSELKVDAIPPTLVLYAPSVLDLPGDVRLAWQLRLTSEDGFFEGYDTLVDALDGILLAAYPLSMDALNRSVFDAANGKGVDPGTLIRTEGGGNCDPDSVGPPPCHVLDANRVYAGLFEAYVFYYFIDGRDGIDDDGMVLSATVRYCPPDPAPPDPPETCPWGNARWSGSQLRLYFGQGWGTDDMVGHEYTHGVTQFESGLIYQNQSGAINESLSDIFGELIDQSNGRGTDTPNPPTTPARVRWLLGEDLAPNGWGAIRDLQNPPAFGDPDIMGGAGWWPFTPNPNRQNDYGGVHHNSGVGNKLAYLLTDGDTFNGQLVFGLGSGAVRRLFYEANCNLLPPAATYVDLRNALEQAAINLNWSAVDRANVGAACVAVGIAHQSLVYINAAHSGCEAGTMLCPFNTVTEGVRFAAPNDTLIITAGTYHEALTINDPLTLSAQSGTVVIQGSP